MKNPQKTTKVKFNKVIGYRINMQRLVVFLLYTSSEQSKNEIKKVLLLTIASKRIFKNKFNKNNTKLIL